MEESINKQLSRLLGEIKKGHAKALGGIQLLLESRLSKVISGFFLQEADREDILEDTYLRIVLEIHTYKRDENPSAWIIRILKSIIFTKLKKQKREVSMEDARLERRGMYSSRGSEEYIENYLLTRKVFEHLNDYDRDLVMLHWWFDNSFGEIALLYNKPKSTIQS